MAIYQLAWVVMQYIAVLAMAIALGMLGYTYLRKWRCSRGKHEWRTMYRHYHMRKAPDKEPHVKCKHCRAKNVPATLAARAARQAHRTLDAANGAV